MINNSIIKIKIKIKLRKKLILLVTKIDFIAKKNFNYRKI